MRAGVPRPGLGRLSLAQQGLQCRQLRWSGRPVYLTAQLLSGAESKKVDAHCAFCCPASCMHLRLIHWLVKRLSRQAAERHIPALCCFKRHEFTRAHKLPCHVDTAFTSALLAHLLAVSQATAPTAPGPCLLQDAASVRESGQVAAGSAQATGTPHQCQITTRDSVLSPCSPVLSLETYKLAYTAQAT